MVTLNGKCWKHVSGHFPLMQCLHVHRCSVCSCLSYSKCKQRHNLEKYHSVNNDTFADFILPRIVVAIISYIFNSYQAKKKVHVHCLQGVCFQWSYTYRYKLATNMAMGSSPSQNTQQWMYQCFHYCRS